VTSDAIGTYFFCNGKLRPAEDSGLFEHIGGVTIYEVIKLIGGIPLFFEDHMLRMSRSAELIGRQIEKSASEVRQEILQLVEKNRLTDVNVKLVWAQDTGRTVFMTYFIQRDLPPRQSYRNGVHTILYSGERENPQVKSIKTSYRERARHAREAAHAYEALLVDENGYISEGTRSNIFFIKDAVLFTPPSEAVLLGVTRHHVLQQCRRLAITIREAKLHRNELNQLEGAFITGTSIDVLPIGSIDSIQLPSASHTLVQKIARAFEEGVQDYLDRAARK
jgi:branched-chain amino acid aminotransferase